MHSAASWSGCDARRLEYPPHSQLVDIGQSDSSGMVLGLLEEEERGCVPVRREAVSAVQGCNDTWPVARYR